MNAIGWKLEEEDWVVIKSLPASFEHFIETLNITSTDADLKFGKISTKLVQQDRWKKQFGISSENEGSEMALATNFKGKVKFSKNYESSRTYDVSNQKTLKCHYCGKMGCKKFSRNSNMMRRTTIGQEKEEEDLCVHGAR